MKNRLAVPALESKDPNWPEARLRALSSSFCAALQEAADTDSADEYGSDSDVNGFVDPMKEAEQYASPSFGPDVTSYSGEKESSLSKREIVTADRLRGEPPCTKSASLDVSRARRPPPAHLHVVSL